MEHQTITINLVIQINSFQPVSVVILVNLDQVKLGNCTCVARIFFIGGGQVQSLITGRGRDLMGGAGVPNTPPLWEIVEYLVLPSDGCNLVQRLASFYEVNFFVPPPPKISELDGGGDGQACRPSGYVSDSGCP